MIHSANRFVLLHTCCTLIHHALVPYVFVYCPMPIMALCYKLHWSYYVGPLLLWLSTQIPVLRISDSSQTSALPVNTVLWLQACWVVDPYQEEPLTNTARHTVRKADAHGTLGQKASWPRKWKLSPELSRQVGKLSAAVVDNRLQSSRSEGWHRDSCTKIRCGQ